MHPDWDVLPLGSLTRNFDAQRIPVKQADRKPGRYPYYGASGVVDHVDEYLFDGDYLLIAEDGENLRTRQTPVAFIARGRFWVNNHAHVVQGNELADTRFLMYALRATDISGFLTGSTMPKLTQGNMNRIPLRVPPPTDQRAIAHILGTLDDRIELGRRMSETLDEMARAIFKSWFVDFDPVQARAAGKQGGLSDELIALFPPMLVPSELGEIPDGWSVGPVGDLLTLSRASLSPQKFPGETFSHFSLPAFDGGRRPVADLGASIKSNKYEITDGAVLLSKLNPRFSRVWRVDHCTDRRRIASTEFLVCLARDPCPRDYLYSLFRSDGFRTDLMGLVTGTSGSHQRVRPDGFLGMEVVQPSDAALAAFERMVAPMFDRVSACESESETLGELRDTLLPKLVSGELRVPDAEKFVESIS